MGRRASEAPGGPAAAGRAVRQGAQQDAARHLEQALTAISPALPGDVRRNPRSSCETRSLTVLTLASLGNVHTKTMRAFTDEDIAGMIAQLG